MEWHAKFETMKQRPHVLCVCPSAVASSWRRVCETAHTIKLWPHQQQMAQWLLTRNYGMLAADMGCGKSLAAVHGAGSGGRELVFVDLCAGSVKQRADRLRQAIDTTPATKTVWAVCNYEAVWRQPIADLIEKIRWQAIVLDESHRAKSPNGKASKWLGRLGQKHRLARRICLTGTPLPQGPLDSYGQARFLDPEIFGPSYVRFRHRYAECDPVFKSMVRRYRNQDEFAEKLDEFSWRVTSDEVLDLPDAIHEDVRVILSAKERRYHDALESQLTAQLADGTVTANNALTRLLRMQQGTSGYAHLDDGGSVPIDGIPTKRRVLTEMLEDLPAVEPVVVFCRFRADLADVRAVAAELGREYAEVSGSASRGDLERWQDGNATILGVQIQSGGAGIDLSRSAYAFYYSLGFSLGDYEQSLARLRRPGQTRMVRYYHLIASSTVDETVYAALRDRKNVIEAVMSRMTRRVEVTA